MPLFQTSVLKKYLKGLDRKAVNAAFGRFVDYFHDPARQKNIRNSKEEQFQEGFLRELFVKVFGYTLKPEPGYNLTTEFKNLKGAKKADGAILMEEKAIAVVELKGTDTTNLDKVEEQAFGYKNNHPGCQYVVISNFEKLRFYIDNTVDFEEFNLFRLTKERFETLWLCLSKESVFTALPKQVKKDSVLKEENVTKKLYKDYSAFKKALLNDIMRNNPTIDKLTLFKKSQKLIDRLLFIFFAEDKGLLPPNSISRIVKKYETLIDADFAKPLYEVFQQYFGYINKGRPAKEKKAAITAYNGGLFNEDKILNNLNITDHILMNHSLVLSGYDFASEVDVNILGHIFEHSLNEIDEITAELEGREIEKRKTKRKKDGVFYTPKYITKYIVDNTVGKLCGEKKKELNLTGVNFSRNYRTKKRRTNKAGKKTNLSAEGENIWNNLNAYREFLLELTICDPACGSGAFLNQALNKLIELHHEVDELQTMLMGDSIVFPDVEAAILENNLYGVDINEESVDIAKLSLWLRTAKKGRALTSLNNNIKCGNSLIDDPAVAGEKAFNWEKEFPHVFARGGFDVVIGNPPYLAGREWTGELKNQRSYFSRHYDCMTDQFDLYGLFIQKCKELLRDNCLFSFITPNTWFNNNHYFKLRKWAAENFEFEIIADFKNVNVFKDATVLTAIFVFRNVSMPKKDKLILASTYDSPSSFKVTNSSVSLWESDENLIFNLALSNKDLKLLTKISLNSKPLTELGKVRFGVKVYQKGKGKPKQIGFESKEKIFESMVKEGEDYYPYLRGKNVKSFSIDRKVNFLKYGLHLAEPRNIELFKGGRILIRRIVGEKLIVCPLKEHFIADQLLHTFKPTDESQYLCIGAVLHSNLMAYYFKKKYNRTEKTFPEIRVGELGTLPIKIHNKKINKSLSQHSESLLESKVEMNIIEKKFIKTLKRKFELKTVSKSLQNWHTHTFFHLLKELKKEKRKPSLSEEAEWEEYFESERAKVEALQKEIDLTNREIDRMVYELYGLTEEEIATIEFGLVRPAF